MATTARAASKKALPAAPPPGESRSVPVDPRYYPANVEVDLTIPQRCAQYLNDCAQKYPYQLIRYDEIYRNIHLLKKRGSLGVQDIRRTKQQVRSSNRWLEQYGRTIVLGEMGARASVDDQDVVESVAPKKMGRINSSIRNAQQMDAIVNTKNLQGEMGTWYKKDFRPALETLGKVKDQMLAAAPETKALPPKSE